MAADSDGDQQSSTNNTNSTLKAVVICEGNLHDPDFQSRLDCLVAKLTTLVDEPADNGKLKVDKVEFCLLRLEGKRPFNHCLCRFFFLVGGAMEQRTCHFVHSQGSSCKATQACCRRKQCAASPRYTVRAVGRRHRVIAQACWTRNRFENGYVSVSVFPKTSFFSFASVFESNQSNSCTLLVS